MHRNLYALLSLVCVWSLAFPTNGQELSGDTRVNLNTERPVPLTGLINDLVQNTGEKILFREQDVGQLSVTIRTSEPLTSSSLLPILEQALRDNGLALMPAQVPGWKTIVRLSELPQPKAQDTPIVTEFVEIENVDASELSIQLKEVLTAQRRAETSNATDESGTPTVPSAPIEISQDGRTNRLVLIGEAEEVRKARDLIGKLDVDLELTTRTYAFRNVSAERIDSLVKELISELVAQQRYRSAVDKEDNLLIATTTSSVHSTIRQLQESRDVAARQAQSPMQFYKVKNLPVNEVLETIRAIERQTLQSNFNPLGETRRIASDGRIRPAGFGTGGFLSGPNRLPGQAGQIPLPPSYQETPPFDDPQGGQVVDSRSIIVLPGQQASDAATESNASEAVESTSQSSPTDLLGQARVTADVHTNTLIVVASPSVQRLYADLINQLDKRRPQVLIEAQFVVLNSTDDFSIGVEFSTGDRSGDRRALAFTSFGLSDVDPVSGALSIIPGLGFNGTVVDPEVADVVIRALKANSHSRVTSSPRVVVNDNATGQLTSVAEVPFTSVNASQTVATTSFAGFAEAGTTITVTPRISDDSHLQLEFTITQNTFTGGGSDGVPPPRQTDEVTSQVTIPDGHTVIVGGLRRSNYGDEYDGLPIINRIPVLRLLGGNLSRNTSCSSTFVFLRPVILRDDKFKDLKYLSERDGECAGIAPDYPESAPIVLP